MTQWQVLTSDDGVNYSTVPGWIVQGDNHWVAADAAQHDVDRMAKVTGTITVMAVLEEE